jgi:hypothetical protein
MVRSAVMRRLSNREVEVDAILRDTALTRASSG